MTKSKSLKRRLVRAAVQDNVNIIREPWRSPEPQNSSRRSVWLSRAILLGVAIALLPLLYAVTTVSETNRAPTLEGSSLATPLAEPDQRAAGVNLASSTSAFARNLIDPETLASVPQRIDLQTFALPVRRIVIDPGHGGDDPGAVTAEGVLEKEIALDIGLRLRDLLVAAAFDVRMTREKDTTLPLAQRVVFANQAEGDLFVSIHLNWVEPRKARVVETYYLGPTEDSAALQLAGLENTHSGYSLVDFRRLLEQVYTDVKRSESHRLAEAVQGELMRSLKKVNPLLPHRTVKTAPFVVLVGANMPAILTEVACLSNMEDVRLLASSGYRQQIARALFAGVQAYTTALYQANATRKDVAS